MYRKVITGVLTVIVLAAAPAQAGSAWTTVASAKGVNPEYGPSVSVGVDMRKPAAAQLRVKASRSGTVHALLSLTCYKENFDSAHKSKSADVSVSAGTWKAVAFPSIPSGSFVYCDLSAFASSGFSMDGSLQVQLQRK